ncbi:hypothetical protein GNI_170360, partial [Gregarina niphandrodes]
QWSQPTPTHIPAPISDPELVALQDCFTVYSLALAGAFDTHTKLRQEKLRKNAHARSHAIYASRNSISIASSVFDCSGVFGSSRVFDSSKMFES